MAFIMERNKGALVAPEELTEILKKSPKPASFLIPSQAAINAVIVIGLAVTNSSQYVE